MSAIIRDRDARRRGLFYLVLLAAGLLAALTLVGRRSAIETHANRAAVVMSYADIRLLADAAGVSAQTCMEALSVRGESTGGAAARGLAAVVLSGAGGTFDDAAAREIHAAGLRLTLSPTDEMTAAAYRAARETGNADFPVYLPMGGRVDTLEETGLAVALVEDMAQYTHVPIDGFDAGASSAEMVRAFYLAPEYQRRYGVYGYAGAEEIENILYRAAVDRRARVLWLTPFINPETDEIVGELSEYAALLESLSDRLLRQGISTGDSVSGIAPYAPDVWLLILCYIGVAATLPLLLRTVVTPPAAAELALLAAGAAAFAGGALYAPELTAKAAALGAAAAFPCLAAALLAERLSKRTARRGAAGLLADSFLCLLCGLTITLAGGAFVGAILSDSRYLLTIDSFSGVKLSQALPLAYTGLLLCLRFFYRPGPAFHDARMGTGTRGALGAGALAVVCVLALGAAVAFFVLGTGDGGFLRGGLLERRLRNLLEITLSVRPRLKELLLSWPALVLSVLFAGRGLRLPAAVCLFAAAAGFASAINTFCHIRADVLVSFVRTALGAAGGYLLGLVLALLLYALVFRRRS